MLVTGASTWIAVVEDMPFPVIKQYLGSPSTKKDTCTRESISEGACALAYSRWSESMQCDREKESDDPPAPAEKSETMRTSPHPSHAKNQTVSTTVASSCVGTEKVDLFRRWRWDPPPHLEAVPTTNPICPTATACVSVCHKLGSGIQYEGQLDARIPFNYVGDDVTRYYSSFSNTENYAFYSAYFMNAASAGGFYIGGRVENLRAYVATSPPPGSPTRWLVDGCKFRVLCSNCQSPLL